MVLITTLLDPEKYPSEQIAKLFLQRWSVELFLPDIKTVLHMEHFRCKTPAMVH